MVRGIGAGVPDSARPQCEQRIWILFSGKRPAEKKPEAASSTGLGSWDTSFVRRGLPVAVLTRTPSNPVHGHRSFRKEDDSHPQQVQLAPLTRSLGAFPVVSCSLAAQIVANILPTLICFLCLGSRVGPTESLRSKSVRTYALKYHPSSRLSIVFLVSFRRRGR